MAGMKKIIIFAIVIVCIFINFSNIDGNPICKKNQYLRNSKCKKCPHFAFCNGIKFRCLGGYAQTSKKFIRFNMAGMKKIIIFAIVIVCIFINFSNIDGNPICEKNQYLRNSKCKKCPKYAFCDGIKFWCIGGYAPLTDSCMKAL
ncbi:hypothetical protein PV325_005798 [Microctonus aethiopoides]|nr:hypothetical protein PV325_005798 [Microctonus aethiopoides]